MKKIIAHIALVLTLGTALLITSCSKEETMSLTVPSGSILVSMPYADTENIPKIAHYKINFKPWKFNNVPYGELFWRSAEKTCYYEEILAGKENYGDELKLRDKKQYEELVRLTLTEINEKEREQEIFDNAMLFAIN